MKNILATIAILVVTSGCASTTPRPQYCYNKVGLIRYNRNEVLAVIPAAAMGIEPDIDLSELGFPMCRLGRQSNEEVFLSAE